MKTERSMTELVAAIRGGDQDAFTELYKRTSQEVYRTARAVLRDEDQALDVQQDTFVYAYQHLDQLSEPEKFRPWLRTIAVNRAKSVLRKNTPVLFTELENDEGEGLPEQADLSLDASPELSLERKETAELVSEILSGLSDGQRAAVAMYYYEQMSVNEIAASLGVSSSTVKNQLAKGRKKIEEAVRALEKKGVKLYGLSPVGFLVALMKKQAPTAQAGEAVLAKTLASAGLSAGTKTAAAAAVTAVPVTTSTFGHVLAGRLAAGILAVALIGGGIWGGAKLLKSSNTDAPYQPTTSVTDERMAGVETPEELTETVVPETEAVVAPTDATVVPETEPVVTEPKETEPVATEPKETEPEETEAEETGEFVPDPSWPTGSCGDNLTWYFDAESGCLTLVGSGAMNDYTSVYGNLLIPWSEYQEQITALTLPEGMTYVGARAFEYCQIKSVRIPSTVTRIGRGAFSDTGLQSVTLPEGLTEIGRSAFYGCKLQSVTLPESLKLIDEYAFNDCPLKSITIPASVESFGEIIAGEMGGPLDGVTPFDLNETLEEINVDPANATYCSVDGVLFSKDRKTLLRYPCGKPGEAYTVPDGVQEIGYNAFYCNKKLRKLTLPDGLKRIDAFAFSYCDALLDVNLPDSVTSIGKDVLCATSYAKMSRNWYKDALYLGNWLICVEDGAIQTIEIREGTIGLADYSCSGNIKFTLTSVKLPNGLRYIGYGVFLWDNNLSEVTIPDSVIEIGDSAFAECAALSELKLGSGLQRIGKDAFDNCDALVDVTIPANVTEIGEDAFGYTYRQQNGLVPGFTIHGKAGTAAQSYADANGFTFVAEAE